MGLRNIHDQDIYHGRVGIVIGSGMKGLLDNMSENRTFTTVDEGQKEDCGQHIEIMKEIIIYCYIDQR